MTTYSYDSKALPAENRIDIIEPPFTERQLDTLQNLSFTGCLTSPLNAVQEAVCEQWSAQHRIARKSSPMFQAEGHQSKHQQIPYQMNKPALQHIDMSNGADEYTVQQ